MRQTYNNSAVTGVLCAICANTLYGLSYMFTKNATNEVSTFALLGWRFLVAFIIINLCVVTGIIKINLKHKPKGALIILSLMMPCLYFIGETFGIDLTTTAESGVIIGCIPVASITASALILKKKPSRFQTAGILLTLAGVVITVVFVGVSAGFSAAGYSFLALAVVSYAVHCVWVERSSVYTEAEKTYGMLTAGAIVFISLALIEAAASGALGELAVLPLRSPALLKAVLYQGIGCSIFAFFLSNIAISRIGVNGNAAFVGLATVFSIFSGAVILKERFTVYQLVGAVIIIAGVYIANIRKKPEKVPEA